MSQEVSKHTEHSFESTMEELWAYFGVSGGQGVYLQKLPSHPPLKKIY